MSVIDRKNRARRQYAEPVVSHSDPRISAFAQGCLQHHADDFWFHQNATFVRLSTQFAVELREQLAAGLGHQAGFLGHISVELLLDWTLDERDPRLMDRYYALLASLDVELVQAAAGEICRKPVTGIVDLLPRFIEVRFLESYRDDQRLLTSLNRVMKRIGLPMLPAGLTSWLPSARARVQQCADKLLSP